MGIYIVKGDITEREVDAIGCSANSNLKLGGILGKKIVEKGGEGIKYELKEIGHCEVGKAVITHGGDLLARYIIHMVGPVYKDGKHGEKELLRSVYRSALTLAVKYNLETVEFPLISSGAFGYPVREASEIALSTIEEFLKDRELSVGLVIYNGETFKICRDIYEKYDCYEGEGYLEKINPEILASIKRYNLSSLSTLGCDIVNGVSLSGLDIDFPKLTAPTFADTLIKYLNKSGKTSPEVYNKANIDKTLFSKLISGTAKSPMKRTVCALIIGMELNIEEAEDLLESAGYVLTNNNRFDNVIRVFIERGIYDYVSINAALLHFGAPPLQIKS